MPGGACPEEAAAIESRGDAGTGRSVRDTGDARSVRSGALLAIQPENARGRERVREIVTQPDSARSYKRYVDAGAGIAPVLGEIVRTGEPETRVRAARILAVLSKAGVAARADLQAASQDADPEVARAARKAFSAVSPSPARRIARGVKRLLIFAGVPIAIAYGLFQLYPVRAIGTALLAHCGAWTAPIHRRALHDRNLHVRIQAAQALENIGPQAKDAVPDLITGFSDSDWNFRVRCQVALGRIGVVAVPALIEALASPQTTVRLHAARTLEGIGAPASSAQEALERTTHDPDPEVGRAAQQAIAKIRTREPS